MKVNLELVDTVPLIEELTKRFDNAIFLGLKPARNETTGATEVTPFVWKYKGGAVQSIGLCHVAADLILQDIGQVELTDKDL